VYASAADARPRSTGACQFPLPACFSTRSAGPVIMMLADRAAESRARSTFEDLGGRDRDRDRSRSRRHCGDWPIGASVAAVEGGAALQTAFARRGSGRSRCSSGRRRPGFGCGIAAPRFAGRTRG
jgi:hypothetical protein